MWRRMLGPSNCTSSALDTIRFKIDSAMTASCSDLYQSSGSNCEVTTVDPLPSRDAKMLRSSAAVSLLIGVVKKSSNVKPKIMRSSQCLAFGPCSGGEFYFA